MGGNFLTGTLILVNMAQEDISCRVYNLLLLKITMLNGHVTKLPSKCLRLLS